MSGTMVPALLSSSNESALRAMFATKAPFQASAIRQGLDSGYASAATTKNNSPELDCSLDAHVRSNSFVQQLQRPRKIEQLNFFNLPIPQAVQDRFDDLNELFSARLIRYLSKAKVELTGISIRLRTLGASEKTAIPWVLVQCDKSASKKVKKFFNQPDVKREYQGDAASELPHLPIYILERPPRLLAADFQALVYSDQINHLSPTLCGSLIGIGELGDRRSVTIGGLIKVKISDDEFVLYGMTAGHSVVSSRHHTDDSDRQSEDDSDAELEEDEDDDEDEEHDEGDDVEYVLNMAPLPDMETGIDHEFQSVESPKIGWLAHISENNVHDKTNTDWALIRLDLPSLYLPNILTRAGSKSTSSATQKEIVLESTSCSKFNRHSRKVRVIGGVSGNQFGILSISTALVLIAPSKMFMRAHSLVLPDGKALKPGDSGSWVVDAESGVLYGHVVASDVSGEVHVIPIEDTLQHMEEQLMPECISLPTREDIALWLAQCSLTSPDIPLVFSIDDNNYQQELCHEDKSLVHGFQVQFQMEDSSPTSRTPRRPRVTGKRLSRFYRRDSLCLDQEYYPPSLEFWDESTGFNSDSGYSSSQLSPDLLSLESGCDGFEDDAYSNLGE